MITYREYYYTVYPKFVENCGTAEIIFDNTSQRGLTANISGWRYAMTEL